VTGLRPAYLEMPVQRSADMKTNSQPVIFDSAPIAPLSYDECVERLAHTVDHRDDSELEEVAHLIGQLAVVIE
jgi:hypothetical protein